MRVDIHSVLHEGDLIPTKRQIHDSKAIDVHVGGRLRMRRLIVEMSQEELGSALGITFQQVQKYEKGSNRIGAGRLFELAQILGVSIEFFFEGLEASEDHPVDDVRGPDEMVIGEGAKSFLSSREAVEFNRAFIEIECAKSRRAIVTLVRSLGDIAK